MVFLKRAKPSIKALVKMDTAGQIETNASPSFVL